MPTTCPWRDQGEARRVAVLRDGSILYVCTACKGDFVRKA